VCVLCVCCVLCGAVWCCVRVCVCVLKELVRTLRCIRWRCTDITPWSGSWLASTRYGPSSVRDWLCSCVVCGWPCVSCAVCGVCRAVKKLMSPGWRRRSGVASGHADVGSRGDSTHARDGPHPARSAHRAPSHQEILRPGRRPLPHVRAMPSSVCRVSLCCVLAMMMMMPS
jgi:hypothetical protein